MLCHLTSKLTPRQWLQVAVYRAESGPRASTGGLKFALPLPQTIKRTSGRELYYTYPSCLRPQYKPPLVDGILLKFAREKKYVAQCHVFEKNGYYSASVEF